MLLPVIALLAMPQPTLIGAWEGRIVLAAPQRLNRADDHAVADLYRKIQQARLRLDLAKTGTYILNVPQTPLDSASKQTGRWTKMGTRLVLMRSAPEPKSTQSLTIATDGDSLTQVLKTQGDAQGKLIFTRIPQK